MEKKISVKIPNNSQLDFIWCPPGNFTLATRGTSLFQKTKKESVKIFLSEGFWMSSVPVTISQWNDVLGPGNRFANNINCNIPVYGIDYNEAAHFLAILNKMTSIKTENGIFQFSLPNYLEWQFACVARFDDKDTDFWRGYTEFAEHAWFADNSRNLVNEVALKRPNPWGLFDMYGNIYEICGDVSLKIINDTFIVNPRSIFENDLITVMGGCYLSTFEDCQLQNKRAIAKENSFIEPLGIRLILRKY